MSQLPDVPDPHMPRDNDAKRSSVLERQRLSVHLEGQQYVAVWGQGLLDRDGGLPWWVIALCSKFLGKPFFGGK